MRARRARCSSPSLATTRAHRRAPSFRSELVGLIARGVFEELSIKPDPDEKVLLASDDLARDLPPRERLLRALHAYSAKRLRHHRDQSIAKLGLPRRHDPDRECQVWGRKPRATDARAADFNVVHFSLQHDHIHLLVEATDAFALSCGMRRLIIRLANRINAVVRRARKGKVWGDRYHRHDLENPTEVRNALVYVLQNGRKHGVVPPGDLDRLSSAMDHAVWADLHVDPRPHGLAPRTWLMGVGWAARGGGLLLTSETPRTRVPACA